jgi:hypothetical protein
MDMGGMEAKGYCFSGPAKRASEPNKTFKILYLS